MKTILALAVLLSLQIQIQLLAQAGINDPESMIRQIYSEVSSEGEEEVNWEKVRSFFVDEAIVVLQTSREASTRFTLEEFIQDFKDFYASPAAKGSGFKETVLRTRSHVYGDMAYVGVVYEARILNSERPAQKGIDYWLLQQMEKGWKVIAVTNQIIPPGEEIPAMFDN